MMFAFIISGLQDVNVWINNESMTVSMEMSVGSTVKFQSQSSAITPRQFTVLASGSGTSTIGDSTSTTTYKMYAESVAFALINNAGDIIFVDSQSVNHAVSVQHLYFQKSQYGQMTLTFKKGSAGNDHELTLTASQPIGASYFSQLNTDETALVQINQMQFKLAAADFNQLQSQLQSQTGLKLVCAQLISKYTCTESFTYLYNATAFKYQLLSAGLFTHAMTVQNSTVAGDEFIKPSSFPWIIVEIVCGVVGGIILIVVLISICGCHKKALQEEMKVACFDGKKIMQKRRSKNKGQSGQPAQVDDITGCDCKHKDFTPNDFGQPAALCDLELYLRGMLRRKLHKAKEDRKKKGEWWNQYVDGKSKLSAFKYDPKDEVFSKIFQIGDQQQNEQNIVHLTGNMPVAHQMEQTLSAKYEEQRSTFIGHQALSTEFAYRPGVSAHASGMQQLNSSTIGQQPSFSQPNDSQQMQLSTNFSGNQSQYMFHQQGATGYAGAPQQSHEYPQSGYPQTPPSVHDPHAQMPYGAVPQANTLPNQPNRTQPAGQHAAQGVMAQSSGAATISKAGTVRQMASKFQGAAVVGTTGYDPRMQFMPRQQSPRGAQTQPQGQQAGWNPSATGQVLQDPLRVNTQVGANTGDWQQAQQQAQMYRQSMMSSPQQVTEFQELSRNTIQSGVTPQLDKKNWRNAGRPGK